MFHFILNTLFSKNIFGRWELKSFGEKLRSITLLVTLTMHVYLVYDGNIMSSLKCRPDDSISSSSVESNDHGAECPSWMTNYPYRGLILIFGAIAIDVIWAMIPKVQQTFETMHECDETVSRLGLSPHEMRDIVRKIVRHEAQIHPVASADVVRSMKLQCHRLWSSKGTPPISVERLYALRNTLSSAVTALFLLHLQYVMADRIACLNSSRNGILCVLDHQSNHRLFIECLTGLHCAMAAHNIFMMTNSYSYSGYWLFRLLDQLLWGAIGSSLTFNPLHFFIRNILCLILFALISTWKTDWQYIPLRVGMVMVTLISYVRQEITVANRANEAIYIFSVIYMMVFALVFYWVPAIFPIFPTARPEPRRPSIENDNRFVLGFIQNSGGPLKPETEAILFPSQFIDE